MYPSVLRVDVADSRWRRRYLTLAHLIGGGALLLAALPAAVQWASMAGLVVSLYFYARPVPLTRMRCQQDGSLQVGMDAQQGDVWQTVEINSSSCITPVCVLLRFTQTQERRCRNVLILSDSMPASDFRRLRIWLRWRARSGAAVPDQ